MQNQWYQQIYKSFFFQNSSQLKINTERNKNTQNQTKTLPTDQKKNAAKANQKANERKKKINHEQATKQPTEQLRAHSIPGVIFRVASVRLQIAVQKFGSPLPVHFRYPVMLLLLLLRNLLLLLLVLILIMLKVILLLLLMVIVRGGHLPNPST